MKDGEIQIIITFVAMIVGLIVFRKIAAGNIPLLSPIALFLWNTSCLMGSYIPVIGWICAKMMIVKNEGDAAAQRIAEEIADDADQAFSEAAERKLARIREEERKRQEQEDLERRISKETGLTARINGNQVDIGDKTYDLEDVKRGLRLY